jgi:voltage-gated sodium channel
VNPFMEGHSNAWLFFIPFIIVTTFMVLSLFIGIIVNAMQEEHAKAEADEREAERQAERGTMHAETAPLLRKIEELREEILALREEVSAKSGHAREQASEAGHGLTIRAALPGYALIEALRPSRWPAMPL